MKTKILYRNKQYSGLTELNVHIKPIILRVKESQLILKHTTEIGCYFTVDVGILLPHHAELKLSVATVFVKQDKFYIKFLGNDPSEYFETEEYEINPTER